MSTCKKNVIYARSSEHMTELPDGSIDFAFADLPFGIGIGKRLQTRARGFRDESAAYEDPHINYVMMAHWFNEVYRVLKSEGSMVCFSGWNHLDDVLFAAKTEHFHIQGLCILHYTTGMPTQKRYVSSHYHAPWWTKHPAKWTFNKQVPWQMDVWDVKREYCGKKYNHPCPTGVKWIEKFISIHTNKGDVVLDFCMGVGGTAIACLNLGRNYVGYEINPIYVETAERRIAEWKSGGPGKPI